MFILEKENTALVVIDIQERLVVAMDAEVLKRVTENTLRLIKGAKVLGVKTICTQQYSKGLGGTIAVLKECLDAEHIEKTAFSCCGEQSFIDALKNAGIKNVVLSGMETHVCVLQTALDLLKEGFGVHVVGDAVCPEINLTGILPLTLWRRRAQL